MTELPHEERVGAVPRHVWGVLLQYADPCLSVKEMYRFRRIGQAGFAYREIINAPNSFRHGRRGLPTPFALSQSLDYNSHPIY
jgi:hypothetical protein